MVGSDLWNQAVNAGTIGADDYLVTADKNRGLGIYTKEELIAFCFNAQRSYYLRPRFFMNLLENSLRNNDMSHIRSFISVLFTSFPELFATGKNR
jgi:hypothetical protein